MRGAQTRRTARSPLRARCAASPLLPSSCSSHPSPLLSLCPPLSPPPPPLLLCLPPPAPPSPLRDDLLRGIASSIPITFCSCQHAVPRCPRAPAAGLRSQGLRPPSDATARCEETLHFYCLSRVSTINAFPRVFHHLKHGRSFGRRQAVHAPRLPGARHAALHRDRRSARLGRQEPNRAGAYLTLPLALPFSLPFHCLFHCPFSLTFTDLSTGTEHLL